MALIGYDARPSKDGYDVVIVGGAMIGSAIAWFLHQSPEFDGRILVVERDASYGQCSTAHTNSCMRQQFSTEINVRISQFGADYVQNFRDQMGGDTRIPDIHFHKFGYMYLADNDAFAERLRENQALQARLGAGTRLMSPQEIKAAYPFYDLDGIVLGSHNTQDEGYFDGTTMFEWWRRSAREQGVEFVQNEVTALAMSADGARVEGVVLATGETLRADYVVNAAGPRAANIAAMAGIDVPIEPRKRYTYVFEAETPLDRDLPLTIDPSGVHVRTDGQYYMAGSAGDSDPAVAPDDFTDDFGLWENKVWPALATRIPQFERIRVINQWVGHYAYNVLDQNAILGAHDRVGNFIFANGFSGHGFQQAPAVGRGIAELIARGAYQTLDLSFFGYERVRNQSAIVEQAVI